MSHSGVKINMNLPDSSRCIASDTPNGSGTKVQTEVLHVSELDPSIAGEGLSEDTHYPCNDRFDTICSSSVASPNETIDTIRG